MERSEGLIKRVEPNGNLYDIIEAIQNGHLEASWFFTEHKKIKAIIRSRIKDYRRQFHWLPEEDLEDIEHGLRPRLIDIVAKFKLPEQRNEGRVVSYFQLRIMGEADFLLKRITGMRQVADEEGNQFLKSFMQSLDGVEDIFESGEIVDQTIIDNLESSRQNTVLLRCIKRIDTASNDRIWLNCYLLRLQGDTWAEIAKKIGYTQTDFVWLKENTTRFVSRLKHQLLNMGEQINCCICGIYTDASDVSICVIDTVDPKNFLIWSKSYETYQDLDKIEGKLGDIFRQFDVTYVIMNEVAFENRALVICMRYLTKREAFVEFVDSLPFFKHLTKIPESIRGFSITPIQSRAYILSQIKRAHIDCTRDRARQTGQDYQSAD